MRSRSRTIFEFLAGWLVGIIALAVGSELFLRWFPPVDLHPYLGESSPQRGIYAQDEDFGFSYASWEAFREENSERLAPLLTAEDQASRDIWMFFGNSFVHAPGMLADHARQAVVDKRIFNLGRNEHLCLRLSQIKLLLEHGIRPERIFFLLMPVDANHLGRQPIDSFHVTSRGALTYRPHLPCDPFGWLISHNRLALTAWVRAGRQHGNPSYRRESPYDEMDATLQCDLDRLLGNLARLSEKHKVPVTLVLCADYMHLVAKRDFVFSDTLATIANKHGLDVLDPRDSFMMYPDKKALFIPDKHYSELGNQLLLAALLEHCRGNQMHFQATLPGASSRELH